MPAVKPGESQNSYLSRAIPEMKGEGLTQKQAVGKAMGMYDEKWTGPKKKGFQKAR